MNIYDNKINQMIASKYSWAQCLFDTSSEHSSYLDPWKFNGHPGTLYVAKDQCEILLRDREAFVFINGYHSTVCDNLQCRTPKRPGIFFAGPALPGTNCGVGKWCEGGACVNKGSFIQTTTATSKIPAWGPWKETQCISECLQDGKGWLKKRRFCNSNIPCEGSSSSTALCEDSKVCPTRKSVIYHATEKCKEFSLKLSSVDGDAVGLQASYESLKLWMPCAVFCKRKNAIVYFAPRVELFELGLNPYFPDGTRCHRDGTENYYCLQHHCLPEVRNFRCSNCIYIE